MRRAYLLAGIAAGTIVLFTTAATVASASLSKPARLERHMNKVQAIAYCQKGYEIASSFPSYASRTSSTEFEKQRLLNESMKLDARQGHLGDLLRGAFKVQAIKLGMDEFSYDNVLAKFEAKGEIQAVQAFQLVGEPTEFLDQLDSTCAPYVTQ